MGKKLKRGQAGNAVQYLSRNQALKRLQVQLGVFRRLCILKGIHPREPKKKTQGQKTYYHVKDINFLLHEPLLQRLREQQAYEKKIRKAKAKSNADLAQRLATRRPTYTLDRLVKERYPAFVDALRDMDDPLSMIHLFAVLPAEQAYNIPAQQVRLARRLSLEWQAYVVRTHALRKVFVTVKGFNYQAEVMGQQVTWLVPHQLAQVLPRDVDYRVMLTFLEFYSTMLQFVMYKLYSAAGARYPPQVDSKLEASAAGIHALMEDIAAAAAKPTEAAQPADPAEAVQGGVAAELELPAADATASRRPNDPAAAQTADDASHAGDAAAQGEAADAAVISAEDDDDELEAPSIPSGDDSDGDEEVEDAGPDSTDMVVTQPAAAVDPQQLDGDQLPDAQPSGATVAGGAADVDADDDAAVCSALFRGLVFYLGREVPREQLLMIIRSFGGTVAWEGEGSPHAEADEAITHQVVDRPTQGHRFLSRQYVQPQWVLDAANWRVLPDPGRYAPGVKPPPHLSPFVNDDDEGYVPDYAAELRRLQEAATAARRRASGLMADALFTAEEGGEEAQPSPADADADDEDEAERQYRLELGRELQAAQASEGEAATTDGAMRVEAETPPPASQAQRPAQADTPEEGDMNSMMMSRKTRKVYESVLKAKKEKRQRAATLMERSKRVRKP